MNKFFKSLKFKSTFIILILNILMIVGVFVGAKSVVMDEFQKIENDVVNENIERLRNTYTYSLDNLSLKLSDWASWDDTYEFIINGDKEYIASNLSSNSLNNLKINFMIFIDNNGKIVHEVGVDHKSLSSIDVPEELKLLLKTDKSITTHTEIDSVSTGVLNLKSGYLKFASRPIVTSLGEGPIRGTIIFATYLDEDELQILSDVVHLPVEIIPVDNMLTSDHKEVFSSLEQGSKNYVLYSHDDSVNFVDGYTLIHDSSGKPIFMFEIEYPRAISLQGSKSINYFLILFVASGAILLITTILFINRLLLNRIIKLSKDTLDVGKVENDTSGIKVDSAGDEITSLQANINDMIVSLQQSQAKVAEKQQFIEKVMDNLVIGIAVNKISTGKAVYMNKAFENIYGWDKSVLSSVDTFFANVYPDPKVREDLRNKIEADIKSEDPARMKWSDVEITRGDGQKRFVEAKNISLPDQDLMVSTVIDVTELKNDKDESKRHTEELEKLNNLMMGREMKMIELKKELEKLGSNLVTKKEQGDDNLE